MMTKEEWQAEGIPLEDTPEALLQALAALEWLHEHTTLEFDPSTPESIKDLPARARLFLCKFIEISSSPSGISSESMEGMSQTFSSQSRDSRLWQEAQGLLDGLLRPTVKFFSSQRRW